MQKTDAAIDWRRPCIDWRQRYLSLITCVLLVVVPYWQQYQTVILLLFTALVVAVAMLQRIRENRRERNP